MKPEERKQKVAEAQLVLEYSAKVYGSCSHAYLGGMAYAHLARQLNMTYGKTDFIKVLAEGTDEQVQIIHDHTYTYLSIAKKYVASLLEEADALKEFHNKWKDML